MYIYMYIYIYDDENNLIRNTNRQRSVANTLTKSRVTAALTGAYTRVYISRLKYNELSLREHRGEGGTGGKRGKGRKRM